MNRSDGFIEAGLLFTICVLSLAAAGLLMYASGTMSLSSAVARRAVREDDALSILERVTRDMSALAAEESDSPGCGGVQDMLSDFSEYGLRMEDVSSGINARFWPESLLEKNAVKELASRDPERYTRDYGWISARLPSYAALARLKSEFPKNAVDGFFPFVNTMPLGNVHYLPADTLRAVLEAFSVSKAEEKSLTLASLAQTGVLSDGDVEHILGLPAAHDVYAVIGVKTAFWKISFRTEFCSVEALFAAVPNRIENPRRVNTYALLERKVTYVGG